MPFVSVTAATAEESSSSYMQFVVQLSEPAIDVVSFDYRTLTNGTAQDNDLYYGPASNSTNGRVEIAPGETSFTISIRAAHDQNDEVDEAITLELSNLSSNAEFTNQELVTRVFGTILDDDGAGENRAIFVSDPVIVERDSGSREAVFDIMLSRESDDPITISYRTADGSAQAGSDYASVNGTYTFLPGQLTTQVRVPVSGDTMAETSEFFSLIVTPPVTPSVDTTGAVGNATILDDDSGPGPVVSVSGGSAYETSSSYIRYEVSLSEGPIDAVSMNYRVLLNGTAISDDLYYTSTSSSNSPSDPLVFAPGQTTASIWVRRAHDTTDERDEGLSIDLFNLSENATFAGGGETLSAMGFAQDNDGLGPNTALEVSNPTLIEADNGTQYAVFDVLLSRPATEAFTVQYETADITARAGSDYRATSGSLTFEPGQDRAAVMVEVIGDTLSESTETFALNITPPANVSIGGAGLSGTATLIDNDSGTPTMPVLSITSVDNSAENSSGYIRYVVTLSEPSEGAVTFDYATSLGTALDNDLYYGSTSSSSRGTGTIDAGATSVSIYIRAGYDTRDERDESVFMTLRNPEGAVLAGDATSLTAVGFIRDDDGLGLNTALSGVPTTVDEPSSGTSIITVPVVLSHPSETELSFDVVVTGGTAAHGSDYTLRTSQVVFAPGQTEASVTLEVNADFTNESPETVVLYYQPVQGISFAGTVPEHTITINNFTQATDGDDVITGSELGDNIDGLAGNDLIRGEGGNDVLTGGQGIDTLNGGAGNDTLIGGDSESDLRDIIYGGEGNDSLDGSYGNDQLRGDQGNDTIVGGFGVDEIFGGDDDDVLTGQAWSDLIFGGNGDDFINGGFGFDRVNGGAGADRFFHIGVEGHGSDWIQDFVSADGDVLVFGGSGATADQFQVNFTETLNAGVAGVEEAFVIYRPTGQILWALIDGRAQDELNLMIGTDTFDLLA